MRMNRKPDEEWAIGRLVAHLVNNDPGWQEDPNFTDKPDLVLERDSNRVACELSTVHEPEAYRWYNARSSAGFDEAEKIVIPREPDQWLLKLFQEKSGKVPEYLQRACAREAWLLVHSTEKDPYDFFVLDNDYDLPLLQGAATDSSHPFSRIYVVSSTVGVRQIWPTDRKIGPPPVLNRDTLLVLEVIRNRVGLPTTPEEAAQRGAGIVNLNPSLDRVLVLPPLEPRRAKT